VSTEAMLLFPVPPRPKISRAIGIFCCVS